MIEYINNSITISSVDSVTLLDIFLNDIFLERITNT